MTRNQKYMITGSVVGLIIFILVGFLPQISFGVHYGVLIATEVYGTPLPDTFAARTMAVLGTLAVATGYFVFFTSAGSLLGSFIETLKDPEKKE